MARDLTQDSRLMLLMLLAEGVEVSGRALAAGWQRSTRAGRLAAQLRRLEVAKLVGHDGAASIDERLFRLTAQGRRMVCGDFDPEPRWRRSWDGVWRMAMFDVPQARASVRAQLRRKLHELRFGWLQNSVWLSPDPIDQLVQDFAGGKVAADSLLFIEGRPAGGETDADLVRAAWDWPRLNKAYQVHRNILRLRPTQARAAKAEEWRHWLETELHAWREIAKLDPFLPEALWPDGYQGRTVWRLRLETLRAAGAAFAQTIPEEEKV